jgi:DNA invertase Pin-like site-specific DNA recombinase
MMRRKIEPSHLTRRAFVYVRQSSMAQVREHAESTKRQYELVERARALGWAPEAIEVIDEDQARSAKSTDGRSGFVRLADAVAHGEVGGMFAVEVSRLSRSSEDWRRLLSLCGVAGVIVGDEERLYDPGDPDDKLLLELKGTMSEAELHWLRLRLVGARQHKARRGALWMSPPTGYVWGEQGFEKDPDEAVQRAIRVLFERYDIEPSAWAVVKWAREIGFKIPTRRQYADGFAEIEWKPPGVMRLYEMLKNPAYAGVYAWGRRREKEVLVDGRVRRVRPGIGDPDLWPVRIENAHPGYISWSTYLQNQERLRQNVQRMGHRVRGSTREGPALLTGLLMCGRCGRKMFLAYARGPRFRRWTYECRGDRERGEAKCWAVSGKDIDRAVEELFLATMVPEDLELSLAVEQRLGQQSDELAQKWRARREQAAYEARRAERRYKAVDPDNRVVARTLEREWEGKLRELEEVERQYTEARRTRRVELSEEDRGRVRALARDLPAIWRAETTPSSDRKAMLRLVIEAISLQPIDVPRPGTRVQVAWQGGATDEIVVYRREPGELLRAPAAADARVRALVPEGRTDAEIAAILNAEGIPTPLGGPRRVSDPGRRPWTDRGVESVRRRAGIPRERKGMPEQAPDGRYSVRGAALRFGVTQRVVHLWITRGLVSGRRERVGPRRQVWWLDIDPTKAAELEALLARKKPS